MSALFLLRGFNGVEKCLCKNNHSFHFNIIIHSIDRQNDRFNTYDNYIVLNNITFFKDP